MGICVWRIFVAPLVLSVANLASGQQSNLAADKPAIVQPGAPGQPSRILSAATAVTPLRAPAEADISFMQGMIMHHSQAVEMTDRCARGAATKNYRNWVGALAFRRPTKCNTCDNGLKIAASRFPHGA